MREAMFNLNTRGPEGERFTTRMKDLSLAAAPPAALGLLVAILTPLVDSRIHEVTMAMAGLADVEVKR